MQKPYLPTPEEIEKMNDDVFHNWIYRSMHVLKEREIERDPATHLKKQISSILRNRELTEVERERQVLREIEIYDRVFYDMDN